MKGRRCAEAALHDHAVAGAAAIVARRAEHVEALLPPRHHIRGDSHREGVGQLAVHAPEIQVIVRTQQTARDRVRDERTRGLSVGEERTRFERVVARGVMHVLPAAGQQQAAEEDP